MSQANIQQADSFQEFPMGVQHRYFTFHSLARKSTKELHEIFMRGLQPRLEDLEGWEFRGWNVSSLTRVLGFQKFKKGFQHIVRPSKVTSINEYKQSTLHGYNVVVRQNRLVDPHLALPNELHPKRHGFYLVAPVTMGEKDCKYPHALLLDYSKGPTNPIWDPSTLLRDYLVKPDPENADLFLGKAYLALGPQRVFAGYFILERYNHIGL